MTSEREEGRLLTKRPTRTCSGADRRVWLGRVSRVLAASLAILLFEPCGLGGGQGGGASLPAPRVILTAVSSSGIGRIAVRLTLPAQPRYPEGAPIVVEVPTFATPSNGFAAGVPAADVGAIHVTFLWPGRTDAQSGVRSDGVDDFGGPVALAALRDVIRFASGLTAASDGRRIDQLLPITPLTENVGLYAFSHPGIPATNVLARYGAELTTVRYFVGGENPTNDALFSVEVGYWGTRGEPVLNPYYNYPAGYSPSTLSMDMSHVGWIQDSTYPDGWPVFQVEPGPDHVLADRVPRMWGKRYYSVALTEALVRNAALKAEAWPADLATVEETRANWPDRVAVGHYASLATSVPGLKVMLVFAVQDHVQPAPDKPHIHQAWDGFKEQAGLWVRLNPDRAYVLGFHTDVAASSLPDNRANREPEDWLQIESWAVPNAGNSRTVSELGALAEMMDRTRAGNWAEDLDAPLYAY